MVRVLRLVEQDVLPRVDAGRDHRRGEFAGRAAQVIGVEQARRDRMHVDHAEDALELVLQRDPVAHRAEIIAEMEIAGGLDAREDAPLRSEEHTSELQSLMRISYAVFCLKKKKQTIL